jgi:hypothetical protein
MAELKYLPAGIRLHAQEFIYKITNRLNEKYYLSFANIPDGLKAEKILKKNKLDFKSIPVPDDIFEACGVSIVSNEYENIVKLLKNNDIEVEVFIYKNNKPVKIYGNLEKERCALGG